jgi:Polyketide cyclase / dehydrase and lipid transport
MMFVLLIVAIIAAFVAYVGTRPDTFAVSRSVDIAAPPNQIFPSLNDFKAWPDWSPYEKIDPAMQRTLGTITKGKGATYAWSGNGKVGAGNMLLTASVPNSLVALDLNMLKPMKVSNKVTFSLIPKGNLTMVTWEMAGKSPFIAKAMGAVMNMDKMVGAQFEEGLANLKRLSEAKA